MIRAIFDITTGDYTLLLLADSLPEHYADYRSAAAVLDEIDLDQVDGQVCFLAVRNHRSWPFLVVTQRCTPAIFTPGALIIPETHCLFIGAGERLLAYRLDQPRRLWEDRADFGFWSWARFSDFVLMSAELELAAWDIHGGKRWSTYVEPPWEYTVQGGMVHLNVMGEKSSFALASCPVTPNQPNRLRCGRAAPPGAGLPEMVRRSR